MKNDEKFEEEWTCREEFDNFWPEHSKVSSVWAKRRYRGVIFHHTEEWCKIWRKTGLWFEKWHEEFGKFSPEHSKVLKLGLWWDPFIQSRICMSSKIIEELQVITMKKANAKFEKELTCCFNINIRNLTNFDPSTGKSQKFAL